MHGDNFGIRVKESKSARIGFEPTGATLTPRDPTAEAGEKNFEIIEYVNSRSLHRDWRARPVGLEPILPTRAEAKIPLNNQAKTD